MKVVDNPGKRLPRSSAREESALETPRVGLDNGGSCNCSRAPPSKPHSVPRQLHGPNL